MTTTTMEDTTVSSTTVGDQDTMTRPTTTTTEVSSIGTLESHTACFNVIPTRTWSETIIGGVSVCATAAAVAAVLVEPCGIVITASLLSIFLHVYAVWQQSRLTKIESLQSTHAMIQHEVQDIQTSNNELRLSIQQLQASLEELQSVSAALEDIESSSQNHSIKAFQTMVQDNERLLQTLQQQVPSQILQHLLFLLARQCNSRDTGNDVSSSQAQEISKILQSVQNIPGVISVDHVRLQQALQSEQDSVESTLKVIRNLLAYSSNHHQTSSLREDPIFQLQQ